MLQLVYFVLILVLALTTFGWAHTVLIWKRTFPVILIWYWHTKVTQDNTSLSLRKFLEYRKTKINVIGLANHSYTNNPVNHAIKPWSKYMLAYSRRENVCERVSIGFDNAQMKRWQKVLNPIVRRRNAWAITFRYKWKPLESSWSLDTTKWNTKKAHKVTSKQDH